LLLVSLVIYFIFIIEKGNKKKKERERQHTPPFHSLR